MCYKYPESSNHCNYCPVRKDQIIEPLSISNFTVSPRITTKSTHIWLTESLCNVPSMTKQLNILTKIHVMIVVEASFEAKLFASWQKEKIFWIFTFLGGLGSITIFGHFTQKIHFRPYLCETWSFESDWGHFRSIRRQSLI